MWAVSDDWDNRLEKVGDYTYKFYVDGNTVGYKIGLTDPLIKPLDLSLFQVNYNGEVYSKNEKIF